ncbi:hypothetical protein HYC85_000917 [Camellia sinensis]|uniref:chorismate mutase n=1 Tax=Camellia sinensis TaxID=4442 RepID=A0A7J7I6E4_CAMSI|nr:hypothetical protein HYC85_000917 [Camellia sinensis]
MVSRNKYAKLLTHSLIRQEDNIIFSLLERAQYCFNVDTYDPNAFFMDVFHGSVDFMVKETKKLHARVGRYKSPNEHPFFLDDLPDPMLPPLQYPQVLHPIADAININNKIWDMYFRDLLTRLVREGDDGNYGSAAVCDTICLQALSKRIHYGKFVVQAKFRASPDAYEAATRAQDRTRLMDLLTYPIVEEAIKTRVEMKAKAYGKEVTDNNNLKYIPKGKEYPILCRRLATENKGFVDLVIEFDLKVTFLKGHRQELTSRYLLDKN